MRVFYLTSFFFITFCAAAQIKNFSVKFSANYPVMNNVSKGYHMNLVPPGSSGYTSMTVVGVVKQAYDEKPGFEASGKFQVYAFKDFFLMSGLGVQYKRFKRSGSLDFPSVQSLQLVPGGSVNVIGQPGQPFGVIGGYTLPRDPDGNIIIDPELTTAFETSDNLGNSTTLYLQLPVTAGKFLFKKKLLLQAGLTTDFLLQATEVKQRYSIDSGISEYKDKHAEGYSKVMLGGTFQATYFLLNHVGIDLGYQRSFSPVYSNSEIGKSYYNIFSMGVSYHFFKLQN